jgi:Ca2+-transporting ATPase
VREAAVISAGSLATFGYGLLRYGAGPQAGSVAFTSLVTGQLLHALSCRSETHTIFDRRHLEPNPYLAGALGASLGLQALTLVVPGLRSFLGMTPLSLLDLLVSGSGAVLPLIINETMKRPLLSGDNSSPEAGGDRACPRGRIGSSAASCLVCEGCAAPAGITSQGVPTGSEVSG